METLASLAAGFAVALSPANLAFALIGSMVGTAVGVLPGIGPIAGIAILLPLTFKLEPTGAIIMLSAIYYGAMYGGTITSVLMNVPGEGASAVTCIDGHQMALRGRGGAALAIAAIGSFVGGTIATMVLVFAGPPMASVALSFGPPEFFALMVLGLVLLVAFSGENLLLGVLSALLGLALAVPGTDFVEGTPRLTFGIPELADGIGFVPVIMGLYGIGEVLAALERKDEDALPRGAIASATLTRADLRASAMPIMRGTAIGTFLGLIPGIGTILPTIASYAAEKGIARDPSRFGRGAIEGVAGPETANNAYANAALIPLLTLGIPGSPTVAIIMGAFMMKNIIPGPFLFEQHADVAWGVIGSFVVGNVILLVLNLPLIPLWVRFLRIPRAVLFTLILACCVIGAYAANGQVFDVGLLCLFGVLGYVFKKLDVPVAPMILTLILGPLMEQSLRQSLEISRGDFMVFLERPIALAFVLVAFAVVAISTLRIASAVRGQDSEL